MCARVELSLDREAKKGHFRWRKQHEQNHEDAKGRDQFGDQQLPGRQKHR